MILKEHIFRFLDQRISIKVCKRQFSNFVLQGNLQNFRNFQFAANPLLAGRQPCLRQLAGFHSPVGQMVEISDTNPFSRSAGPESPTWVIEPQRAGKPLLRNADGGATIGRQGGNAAGGERVGEYQTRLLDLFGRLCNVRYMWKVGSMYFVCVLLLVLCGCSQSNS